MTEWVLVATQSEPWVSGQARYDGTLPTYGEAEASFAAGMVALGIDPWRATSPRDIGYLRRVWWRGDIDTGELVAGWEPWLPQPAADCRVITFREVCGEFFRTEG